MDANWEESDWVDELMEGDLLDVVAALQWFRLLCKVKRDGKRVGTTGVCKRPTDKWFARHWRVPLEAIEKMERAAIDGEALRIEDDCWVVVNWSKYQPTQDERNAERQQRHRDKKAAKEETAASLTVMPGGAA